MTRTRDDSLLFDIAYAIRMKARMPRDTKKRPTPDVGDYIDVARVIVEHVELCGYSIEKRSKPYEHSGVPPMPQHKRPDELP